MRREYLVELGQRVKKIRKQLQINQKDLAKKINISGSYLSEIESGKSKPGYDFIFNISKTCNVSIPYVLHGVGEMFTDIDYGPMTTSKEPKNGSIESLAELLWYLEHSPLLKHNVMGFAMKFIYDNETAVKKEIQKSTMAKDKEDKGPDENA
jgi:transcriptional regulator with XRE-family HTH domain